MHRERRNAPGAGRTMSLGPKRKRADYGIGPVGQLKVLLRDTEP